MNPANLDAALDAYITGDYAEQHPDNQQTWYAEGADRIARARREGEAQKRWAARRNWWNRMGMGTKPTEEEQMTTAEKIAKRFNDDGQCWEDSSGTHIHDLCLSLEPGHSVASDSERFEFADGSAIIITGGAWDIGYPAPAACHCWISQPHHCEEE